MKVASQEVVLVLNGARVSLDREVFVSLFRNSVVASYSDVRKALDGQPMPFKTFLKLTYQAQIPYPLFFAPRDVVDVQVRLKTDKLMAGFTKKSFSMHSRHKVELCDVELIVKDLMRKQELLRRYDPTLRRNPLVGLVRKSRRPVADDAARLLRVLGLDLSEIRSAKSKEAAVELLIRRLESNQVLVSRSAQHHMPQEIPRRAKFSGMTIKDKRVPFIFLATGNEGDHLEPAGRRLFTLVLLTVLIGQETFTPVNYDGHTKDENSPRAYEIAAEILMPSAELRDMNFPDLDALKKAATKFKVTPSAVAMRARHLRRIEHGDFVEFMDVLEDEYKNRPKSVMRSPAPVKALVNYNGIECSRRMLAILDAKRVTPAEFRRVMFFNKLAWSQLGDFREAVG
ncbi:MAG TPA: hypothetical protein DCQ04_02795 [Actinobacteria bacterium]|nr:hypothetical protein [Actinomycetota bacterium]